MKHVIITGGAGFIGSHLCDRFLAEGYAVTAIDNFVTGRLKNLDRAFQSKHFQLIEHDVSNAWNDLKLPLLERYRLDGVLHFACPASPVDFERVPMEILKVDSFGTHYSCELALRHQARYIIASTSEVYGDPLVHPQTESYWGNVNPIGARACYDETKRFAEAYVSTLNRTQPEFRGGIVRIFNTYGPRMRLDDGRIVPELCRRALEGKPLTIHGDGKQTRSFCFVDDLVDGIYLYYQSGLSEPVNLGNPDEQTVLDFALRTVAAAGSNSGLEYQPARADDPKKRRPDISRAKSSLGWIPKISLQEGLSRTINAFRTELDQR